MRYIDGGGRIINAAPINFFASQREQASSWTGITGAISNPRADSGKETFNDGR